MIARAIRFTERFSYFLLKLFAGVGRRFQAIGARARRQRRRQPSTNVDTDQSRVQSLSRLVAFLLVTVVLLIVWSSSGDNITNPVVQLLIGSGPPEAPSAAPQPVANPDTGPAPINTTINTGGTVLFSMEAGGQFDLFALSANATEVTRLTNHPADDRYPVWSPDGTRIAFASKREGNWDLYIMNVNSGDISRLTSDLAYEGEPSWSPDGQFLVYEAYYNANYNVYILRADGSESPIPLTVHPSPDTSPAWTRASAGREVVYASWRDGNNDLFFASLDDSDEARRPNLTDTPNAYEDRPVWDPDGQRIAYQSREDGASLVYTLDVYAEGAEPQIAGQGHSPAWAANGQAVLFLSDRDGYSILLSDVPAGGDTSLQAFQLPGYAYDLSWSDNRLPVAPAGEMAFARNEPVPEHYVEDYATDGVSEDPPYRPRRFDDIEPFGPYYLADTVDTSFIALRQRMIREAGWDFLGRLDAALWSPDQPLEPGQDARNWHMTGRAFSFEASYNEGEAPRVEVVRRQDGTELFWEVYVRTEVQDGSLGQPLDVLPWDLYARFSGDRDAYDRGGTYKREIPSGYYVNFTRIAREYGWYPSSADTSWFYNWPGILFWQYEHRDDLTWEQAMQQIWPSDTLAGLGLAPPQPAPTEGDAP